MIKTITTFLQEQQLLDVVFNIGIEHYLILGSLVFFIGMYGLFKSYSNIISILVSIEMMLLAVSINTVAFSVFYNQISGQVFSLFIITIAAAEAAIGLSLIIVYYRHKGNINLNNASVLGETQGIE